MTTNIVSFLLLSSFRDGASIDEIAIALDSLRRELEWSGRDCGFSGDSIDVINYAVSLILENKTTVAFSSFCNLFKLITFFSPLDFRRNCLVKD